MAEQVTNYQCPNCHGGLQYDAASGKVECPFCGSFFSIAEIEDLYAEKDATAAENMATENERKQAEPETPWDTSGLNEDWGADAENMRSYVCPSCSAELICEATTAATSCPYCGNPTVVPGQFTGALKPDYVIPFKLKKDAAVAALKRHYAGRKLLPDAFRDANHLKEIQGIYVPFWLFDGEAEGNIAYNATRVFVRRSGNYEITRTDHYHVQRAGKVNFSRIPVDGSAKMPDDYMDSVEPFDYSELKPFSAAYLPGYLADKYDISAEESAARADLRAENTIIACLRDTVVGYGMVVEKAKNIRLHRGAVKYALLPVWLLTTQWNGEHYLFAMNGQTGKFVGDLPIDKKKKRKFFATAYAIAALIVGLIVLFPGGLWNLLGM